MTPHFSVIVPSAGRSTRFGTNKLLAPLRGSTVVALSVGAFLSRDDVDVVVVATPPNSPVRDALPDDPRLKFCEGGPTRAESVWAALELVPRESEWVAVHDAARPNVSQALIDRVLAAAVEHGAAGPATPVVSTIKEAPGPLPARVTRTPQRHMLWAMQTPQIIQRGILNHAYMCCDLHWEELTDDLQLLERAGTESWLVEGEERNLKVTTPSDLQLVATL